LFGTWHRCHGSICIQSLLEGEREFAYRSILDWLSYTLLLATVGPAGLRVTNVIPFQHLRASCYTSWSSIVTIISHYTLINNRFKVVSTEVVTIYYTIVLYYFPIAFTLWSSHINSNVNYILVMIVILGKDTHFYKQHNTQNIRALVEGYFLVENIGFSRRYKHLLQTLTNIYIKHLQTLSYKQWY